VKEEKLTLTKLGKHAWKQILDDIKHAMVTPSKKFQEFQGNLDQWFSLMGLPKLPIIIGETCKSLLITPSHAHAKLSFMLGINQCPMLRNMGSEFQETKRL
jgi:hypothetical protein